MSGRQAMRLLLRVAANPDDFRDREDENDESLEVVLLRSVKEMVKLLASVTLPFWRVDRRSFALDKQHNQSTQADDHKRKGMSRGHRATIG